MAGSGLSRRRALTGAAGVGLALPVLAACGDDGATTAAETSPSTSGSGSGSPSPSPSASASSPSAPAGGGFASAADIPVGGGAVFPDEGVVVTQPAAGDFKGFSIECTHAGCPVSEVTDSIKCPCHGSTFSLTDGAPQQGPATEPLGAVELSVDGDQISLA